MELFLILVFIVLILLLLSQTRNRSKIDEGLKLTREIHSEIIGTKKTAGEVVDKHVEINKREGEKLTEAVAKREEVNRD